MFTAGELPERSSPPIDLAWCYESLEQEGKVPTPSDAIYHNSDPVGGLESILNGLKTQQKPGLQRRQLSL